jgi:hypothetical protein
VYDTKYLARCLTGLGLPGASALLPDTSLAGLFKPLGASAAGQQVRVWQRVIGWVSGLESQQVCGCGPAEGRDAVCLDTDTHVLPYREPACLRDTIACLTPLPACLSRVLSLHLPAKNTLSPLAHSQV